MKAHQLINRREKWYDGIEKRGGIPLNKDCAWTAIITAYMDNPEEMRAAESKLIRAIGSKSITRWNDTHDWTEVYELMVKLDI